ncbi:MAG: hypothetical protein JRH15_05265, partial [Deltaproteobacteria bacterium]|nr:hypothetical protein [Deltaproteobacteria bacterium]
MYAPEWQFNATAQYVFSLSDYGFVTFSGGYSWQDDAPIDPIGDSKGEFSALLFDGPGQFHGLQP